MARPPQCASSVGLFLVWLGLCAVLIVSGAQGKVTIYNDRPRLDINSRVVDCHSGNILKHGDTYFLYGEHYGNSTGFNTNQWPRLRVYTSKDLTSGSWVDQGWMLVDAPPGTYFTPWVVYNPRTHMFVAWFNAYPHGCCAGSFGVATSSNGTHFHIITLNEVPKYPLVDSNGLFVDDDGTGYIIYSSIQEDHHISIEKLTPDFLHTTRINYGLFPDRYVEGPSLFKRNGMYYATYGSCCCFCRAGSGAVFFKSKSIAGPWIREVPDKNCYTNTTQVCGAYGDVITPAKPIISAQGITVSPIPTKKGMVYLWAGERWLSAPHNNPNCPDECRPETGICKEPPNYIKGHGFSYWYPLEFEVDGTVKTFKPFVNSFTLDL